MSDDLESPFKRVIANYNQERGAKNAYQAQRIPCAGRLINRWPDVELEEIIQEFNAEAKAVGFNIQIVLAEQGVVLAGIRRPFIEYAIHTANTNTRIAYMPTLTMEMHPDLKAHASIKQEDGTEFDLPLQGDLPKQTLRKLFALYLRDVFKAEASHGA